MKTPVGIEAKLPVGALLAQALQLIYQNRVALFQLLAPALIVLVSLDLALALFFPPQQLSIGTSLGANSISYSSLLITGLSFFISVLYATTSHQFTLAPKENKPTKSLHLWGAKETSYFFRSLQIGLLSVLAFALSSSVLSVIIGKQLVYLTLTLGVICAIYILSRLSIILPESALGKPTSLKRAWAMSKGNGTRMLLIVVIIPALMMAPFVFLSLLNMPLLSIVISIGIYLSTLVSLVILSLSYQFLLEFYEPDRTLNESIKETQENDTKGDFEA